MPIPNDQITTWDENTYVGIADTFDSWRKKTNGLKDSLNSHIADTEAAHAASAISFTGTNTAFTNSTSVQAALGLAAPLSNATFTGTIKFPDGSATEPSITNTGDNNTGIYFPGSGDANSIGFTTDGTERLKITSNGKVGIGKSDPSSKLHIHESSTTEDATAELRISVANSTGNAAFIDFHGKSTNDSFNNISEANDQGIIFSNTGTIDTGTGGFYIAPWKTGTSGLRIDKDGNVGIGTSSPKTLLQLGKTTTSFPQYYSLLATPSTDVDANFKLFTGSGSYKNHTLSGTAASSLYKESLRLGMAYTSATQDSQWVPNSGISFYRGGSLDDGFLTLNVGKWEEALRVAANGKVGIGFFPRPAAGTDGSNTTNPHLYRGGDTFWKSSLNSSNDNIKGALHIYEATGTVAAATSGSLVIEHGNSGGKSSIVFPSKYNRTSDYGYIQYQDDYLDSQDKERSVLSIGARNDILETTKDVVSLQPDGGRVGIGTKNPTEILDVAGNVKADRIVVDDGSVTAPSITNDLDTDTGFYFGGDNTVSITAGGSAVGYFSYNEQGGELQILDGTGKGNLLIDNINGTGRFLKVGSGDVEYGSTGGGNVYFYQNNEKRITIENGGNVGIGITDPSSKLEISLESSASAITTGDANEKSLQKIRSNAGGNGITLDIKSIRHTAPTDPLVPTWQGVAMRIQHQVDSSKMGYIEFNSLNDSRNLVLGTNNTARLLIDKDGKVGIGTSSPYGKLNIHESSTTADATAELRISVANDTGNAGFIDFHGKLRNDDYNNIVEVGDQGIIFSNTGTIDTGTGGFVIAPWKTGTSGLRIDKDGNVNITSKLNSPAVAKAWGSFFCSLNSDGVLSSDNTNRLINSSYNVSSIQKIDSGRYKIIFTNPLPNKSYSLTGTGGYFDNVNPDKAVQGIVSPYILENDYAYINVIDPTGNNWFDPSLVNFNIFCREGGDIIPTLPSGKIYIRIIQYEGDCWTISGKSSIQGLTGTYSFKVNYYIDTWTVSESFNLTNTDYKQIVNRQNAGSDGTHLVISTIKMYNSSNTEIFSFPVNYRYTTGSAYDGGTARSFTVTTNGENTGNYTQILNNYNTTTNPNQAELIFTLSF